MGKLNYLGVACAFAVQMFVTQSSYAATVTNYIDGDFDNADWDNLVLIDKAGAIDAVDNNKQILAGGNPGKYISGDSTWGGIEGLVQEGHFLSSSPYNPSTSGAVTSIDFSIDGKVFESTGGANVLEIGVVIRQGQDFYTTTSKAVTQGLGWKNVAFTGLDASNFTDFDDGAGTVDFSDTGGEIFFGFFTQEVNINATQKWGADNFNLKLTASDLEPPPEIPLPPAILLFGSGLIGLISLARRRA